MTIEGDGMPKAGFCADCGASVWIDDEGACPAGHPASSISGAYETGPTPDVAATPAPLPVPPPDPAEKKRNKWLVIGLVLVIVLPLLCLVSGILVAIAVPLFNASSSNAQQRACFSSQRVIEGAAQQWLADNPEADVADLAGLVTESNPILADGWLEEVPRCALDASADYELDEYGETTCPLGDPPQGHGHYAD